MKMVNASILLAILCISGCSGETVSERHEARAALASGNLEAAGIHLKNALNAAPQDPELHYLNGKLALETGNYDLAKTEFQRLTSHPQFGKEARVLLAQAYLAAGNAQFALQTLGAEPYPSGQAYAIAADASLTLGRGEDAASLINRGLAADPKSGPLILLDTQLAIARGDLQRARSNMARALALMPNDVPTLLQSGRLELIDGNKARAEALFDRVLKRKPGNAVALLAKAALAHERGDRAAAQRFLRSAAQSNDPSNLLTQAFMAQLAIEAGDMERANAIMAAIPTSVPLPYFDLLRGLIAAGRGQNELAISQLQGFIQHGGESAAARMALADALRKTGQTLQAWRALKPLASAANADERVLQLAADLTASLKLPEAASYRERLRAARQPTPLMDELRAANVAISQSNWAEADRIYRRAIEADPDSTNVILFNNAALARLNLKDTTSAIALARRAYELAPNDPVVNDTLGWILFQVQGSTPEVVARMRTALAGQPGNAEIRLHAQQIGNAMRR